MSNILSAYRKKCAWPNIMENGVLCRLRSYNPAPSYISRFIVLSVSIKNGDTEVILAKTTNSSYTIKKLITDFEFDENCGMWYFYFVPSEE